MPNKSWEEEIKKNRWNEEKYKKGLFFWKGIC